MEEILHGVRLAEHDPDTNLSNLRFADDILLVGGSLKHTTTMLDDLTTAATAHGLPLHLTKTQIISHTTSKRRMGNTVAVQGMNIEILTPEGDVGNIHELDVTKEPTERQTQTFRLFQEEAPDNATTDDEEDHVDKKKKQVQVTLLLPRASTTPPTSNPTHPTTNRWTTRLRTTTLTSVSTKKAATKQTATPASTESQKTIQNTSQNHGRLHN